MRISGSIAQRWRPSRAHHHTDERFHDVSGGGDLTQQAQRGDGRVMGTRVGGAARVGDDDGAVDGAAG
jgi:hypothetical protein